MPKLIVIAPYPYRSADTRYRISQFIPGLEGAGWQVTLKPFMDDRLFQIYNKKSKSVEKILLTFIRMGIRLLDCIYARDYDVILLHKEAFPFGPPLMEKFLQRMQPKIIYDMDDAYWTHPPQIRQIGGALRDPNRIEKTIGMSKHVLAGNNFLAKYARQFNPAVTVFPTVLDTERYFLRSENPDEIITIGWVGRWSSSPYLHLLTPVFEQISSQFPQVIFRFVGADNEPFPAHINYEIVPWRLESEVEDIAAFDIGIMPLPDDKYSQGKCGFKLLQYMALGIPGVASPVGVIREIVQDGVNGFIAKNEKEWIEKLSYLIFDQALRHRVGYAARKTVEERFSLSGALPVMIKILEEVYGYPRNLNKNC